MDYEKLLAWNYGDKSKLKQAVETQLAKYKAVPTQSPKLLQRIAEYEAIIQKCNQPN